MAWVHRPRGGRQSRVEDDESVTLSDDTALSLCFGFYGVGRQHSTKNERSEGIGLICLKIEMACIQPSKGMAGRKSHGQG
jgi:hypothetical protein